MPLFRYEAVNRSGNKIVGAMNVGSEQALTERLKTMGYQPVLIEVGGQTLTAAPPAGPAPAAGFAVPAAPPAWGGSAAAAPAQSVPSWAAAAQGAPGARAPAAGSTSNLSASERSLARMYHQLYLAVRAGMPAFHAFTTVGDQVRDRAVREALGGIAQAVQSGLTLSAGMERYPRMFSRGDVGMVRAAEVGGFLPEALESLSAQHEQDDNTRRRLSIWIWFFHSNVATLFLLIPLAFCLKEAIPALDIRPGLVVGAKVFVWVTLPLLALYFGGLALFAKGRNNPSLAYRWHGMLLRVPMAAKINYLRANAVFTRVLQQLYHAGVVAATAWETAAAAVPNLRLSERFLRGKPVVEQTGRLSSAMQHVGLLDPGDIGMVATGETTGEVPQALAYLANHYEEETRVALGSSVMRGAITFVGWAFALGGVAMALIAWAYGTGALKILDSIQ